jgi:TonB family protein
MALRKLVVWLAALTLFLYGHAYASARDPSNYYYRISPSRTPLKVEPVWFAPRPSFPLEARRLHLVGRGLFELHINVDGRVQFVRVTRSTGHSLLDEAAINAFRNWRFRPRSIKVVRVPIEYTFNPAAKSGLWGRGVDDLKELGDGVGIVVRWRVQ